MSAKLLALLSLLAASNAAVDRSNHPLGSNLMSFCPDNYAPVCATDGNTYINACSALLHTVSGTYLAEYPAGRQCLRPQNLK